MRLAEERGHTEVADTIRNMLNRAKVIESAGWRISWDASRGIAQRAKYLSEDVILYEQPDTSEECEYNEIEGRVLSVVGSLVSYETNSGWYCRGNAHPGQVVLFRTINLNTGEEVDIRQLVSEKVIVTALSQDSLVSKALDGRDPEDLQNLIDQADGGCAVSFLSLATSFAFYELRDDRVAVRFGLGHGCEVMRGAVNEIEIELPVPTGLNIEKANADGNLMNSLAPGPVRRYPECKEIRSEP